MDKSAYQAKVIASMKERTGKSLDEWMNELRPQFPKAKAGRLKWVKDATGLGQNTAMMILYALEQELGEVQSPDQLIDAQYQGANAPLRPLYEQLRELLLGLGPDVAIQPCQTYVPFYRKNIFLYLQPVKGKLHIALALSEEASPRLQPAKGLGGPERIKAMVTIEQAGEIDADLQALIRKAYAAN